jgi:hypothetical protein
MDTDGGERRRERRERREYRWRRDGDDMWAHRHVAATSPKPPCKTVGWPKTNDFKSSRAKDFWFSRSMVKIKL